jgi:hypothetical protein
MVNAIITITIVGIFSFIFYTLDGMEMVRGLTGGKKDLNVDVLAEPIFNGKSVSGNLVIRNKNEFAIKNPTLVCLVTDRAGVTMKRISNKLEGTKIESGSQLKLDNYRITVVNDFPSKLECLVNKFSQQAN